MAERDSAFRSMRVGLLLVSAKENIPHGHFEKWAAQTVPDLGRRQRIYCMAIARAAIEQRGLQEKQVKALCAPKLETKGEQLLLDFIGGRSQAELLSDLGIKLRPDKDKGGNNALQKFLREHFPDEVGKSFKQLSAAAKAGWEKHLAELRKNRPTPEQQAEEYWEDIENMIHNDLSSGHRYTHLSVARLQVLSRNLLDAKRQIDALIAKG